MRTRITVAESDVASLMQRIKIMNTSKEAVDMHFRAIGERDKEEFQPVSYGISF